MLDFIAEVLAVLSRFNGLPARRRGRAMKKGEGSTLNILFAGVTDLSQIS